MVFSVYEGISKLTEGAKEHGSFLAGYIVLWAAFVFESGALVVSSREFRRATQAESRSFWEHFKVTRNTTMKVSLMRTPQHSWGSSSQPRVSMPPS